MKRIALIVAIILMAACLAFPLSSIAADLSDDWIVFTVASRHHKRGYNEHNYGIGIEHGITGNWRLVAGTYRNSFYRDTVYAGATYLPIHYGDLHLGGAVILASGYETRPVPMAWPMVSYEQKKWGLNFGPILPTVVGVQLKFRY